MEQKANQVNPVEVGRRLRKVRGIMGLSQNALAEKLHVVQQSVSAWEGGRTYPSIENLCAVCVLSGLSADVILGLDEIRLHVKEVEE